MSLPGAFVGHPLEFDGVGGEVAVLHDGDVFADPVQQCGGHVAVLLKLALRLLFPGEREREDSHYPGTQPLKLRNGIDWSSYGHFSLSFHFIRCTFLNGGPCSSI